MRSLPVRFVLAVPLLVLVQTSAWADDQQVVAPPPPPVAKPVYPAPLSQQTQSTYVPQSVGLSGPAEIKEFDRNRPIPDGYTVVQKRRIGLLIGGGVTFGVAYGMSVLQWAEGEDNKTWNEDGKNEQSAMAIPIVGPFVQITNTDSATEKLLLGGLGAAQITGAILLYYGLTSTRPVLRRNDLIGKLQLTPSVGAGNVVLSGRF